MIGLIKKELIKNIKTFKFIFVVLFFSSIIKGVDYIINNTEAGELAQMMGTLKNIDIYGKVMIATFLMIGYLFISMFSYDVISREIENTTIRFTAPYVSRTKYVLGKYISIIIFWAIVFIIPTILYFILSGNFDLSFYGGIIVYLLYSLSLVFFISVIARDSKTALIVNLGIIVLFPILGALSIKNNLIGHILRRTIPYYGIEDIYYCVGYLFIALIFLIVSFKILKKKEV